MKVFISSVIRGFETFRDAADSAIRTLSHDPVRAESFPASPDTPQQSCLAGVRESDALLLILGARYGSAPPNESSATHEEYNEALRNNIPVLVFVQSGVDPETRQAQFIAMVQKWLSGRLSASFRTEPDLEKKVIRSLHRLKSNGSSASSSDHQFMDRALGRMNEIDESLLSQPLLSITVAGGPTQSILRPSQLESKNIIEQIIAEASSHEFPIFNSNANVTSDIENDALLLSCDRVDFGSPFQPTPYVVPMSTSPRIRRHRLGSSPTVFSTSGVNTESSQSDSSASLLVDDLGSIRISRSVLRPGSSQHNEIQSFIEEHIYEDILGALKLAGRILQRIDPNQRLTRVAIVAGLLGPGHYPWRTQKEQESSPHSASLAWGSTDDPISVSLNPPVRNRSELLDVSAAEIAEDLTVLLRRKIRGRHRF